MTDTEMRDKVEHIMGWCTALEHSPCWFHENCERLDEHQQDELQEDALMSLFTEGIREGRLGMGNRLNKAIFFTTTQPKGQFVKDCILVELNSAEEERLASLKEHKEKK